SWESRAAPKPSSRPPASGSWSCKSRSDLPVRAGRLPFFQRMCARSGLATVRPLGGIVTMSEVLQELSQELASIVERVGPNVVRGEGRRRGPSSGVVWSADGIVVTASHVVEWDEGIEVGLADGATAKASVVGRDPSTDLAVLRAEASGLAATSWSGTD